MLKNTPEDDTQTRDNDDNTGTDKASKFLLRHEPVTGSQVDFARPVCTFGLRYFGLQRWSWHMAYPVADKAAAAAVRREVLEERQGAFVSSPTVQL